MREAGRTADTPEPEPSGSWVERVPLSYRLRRGGLALALGASVALWVWVRQWQLGFFPEKAWAGVIPLAFAIYRLLAWLSYTTIRRYRTIITVFSLRDRIRRAMPWWLSSVAACLFAWTAQYLEDHLAYWWYVWPLGIVFLIGCGIFLVRTEESLTPEAIKEMSWHNLDAQMQGKSLLYRLGEILGRLARGVRELPVPEWLRISVDEASRLTLRRSVRYTLAVFLALLSMSAWNSGAAGPVLPYLMLALAWLAAHELMSAVLRLWPLALGAAALMWLLAFVADRVDISPLSITIALSIFIATLVRRLRP